MISWWNKRFSANNLILLTSAFGLGHKILLPQFTTFTGNNDLFLSALRASRNKRIIFCFKSFISSLDHYDLRIIIINNFWCFFCWMFFYFQAFKYAFRCVFYLRGFDIQKCLIIERIQYLYEMFSICKINFFFQKLNGQ